MLQPVRRKFERGASILTVTILTALVGAVLVVVMRGAGFRGQMTQSDLMQIIRNDVAERVTEASRSGRLVSLAAAHSANTDFAACVRGPAGVPCRGAGPALAGLTLVDAAGSPLSGPASGMPAEDGGPPLATPPGQGYDLNGMRCQASSPACPLEALTGFRATCNGNLTPCSNFRIVYWVRQNPRLNRKIGFTPMFTASSLRDPLQLAPPATAGAGPQPPAPSQEDLAIVSPKGECTYFKRGFRLADTVAGADGFSRFEVSCPSDYPALIALDIRNPCASTNWKTSSVTGPGGFPTGGTCAVVWSHDPNTLNRCRNAPDAISRDYHWGACQFTCCKM